MVKVLDVDRQGKIRLSRKALLPVPEGMTPAAGERIGDAAMYQKSVLTNGLRVVSEELPHFHSVAVGVWLNMGSRDETREENGLSHFLEHMAFKGTPRRSALEIAREIDQIGGSCNAFTSKEQTCFHGRVLAEHLDRLVDLLGDLFLNPLYSSQDLERERQVILEEICAQDDNPEDQVQIAFSRHFWGDTPMGRPILGEAGHIAGVKREDLLAYRQASYRPEETVVAAAGRVRHQDLVNLVGRHFAGFCQRPLSPGTPGRQLPSRSQRRPPGPGAGLCLSRHPGPGRQRLPALCRHHAPVDPGRQYEFPPLPGDPGGVGPGLFHFLVSQLFPRHRPAGHLRGG